MVKGSHSQLIYNLPNNGKTLRNCCCSHCDIKKQKAEQPEMENGITGMPVKEENEPAKTTKWLVSSAADPG